MDLINKIRQFVLPWLILAALIILILIFIDDGVDYCEISQVDVSTTIKNYVQTGFFVLTVFLTYTPIEF